MSGRGREAFPNVREWSGVSPGCSSVVGRHSQMSGSDRKAVGDLWEQSGGPLGCP